MLSTPQTLTIPNVPAQDVTDVFAIQLRPRTAEGRAGTMIYGGTRADLHGCIHAAGQGGITRYTDISEALRIATERQARSPEWDFYVIPHPDGPSAEWVGRQVTPVEPDDDTAMNAAIAAMRQRWEADIARIGERFGREAVNRGWCGDYERVLTDLNEDLEFPIPGRQRRWEVYLPQTVTIEVQVNQQVRNIHAQTREEALEQARSQVNLETLRLLVQNNLNVSAGVARNLVTQVTQAVPRAGSQPEVYEA